jgi:small-conductance mechanosensitive channel
MRRIFWLAAAVMFLVPASGWCQQSVEQQGQNQAQTSAPQHESLGDAARRAREHKKETPKSAKVFTNDNLPAAGVVSSVGPPPAAEAPQGPAAAAPPAGAAPSKNDEKTWREKFAGLRQKLEQDQAELDVMQRELGVLGVQNYSDPVKAMQEQLTRSDINKKTADIEAKKKAVAADKQAISDAEDDLRKSGGSPGWAR